MAMGHDEAPQQAGMPMGSPAGMVSASAVAKAAGSATTRGAAAAVGQLQGAPSSKSAASDAGQAGATKSKIPAVQTARASAAGVANASTANTGTDQAQVAVSADFSRACSSDNLPSDPRQEGVMGALEKEARLPEAFSLRDTDEVFLGAAVSDCKREQPGKRRAAPGAAPLPHTRLHTQQPAPVLASSPLAVHAWGQQVLDTGARWAVASARRFGLLPRRRHTRMLASASALATGAGLMTLQQLQLLRDAVLDMDMAKNELERETRLAARRQEAVASKQVDRAANAQMHEMQKPLRAAPRSANAAMLQAAGTGNLQTVLPAKELLQLISGGDSFLPPALAVRMLAERDVNRCRPAMPLAQPFCAACCIYLTCVDPHCLQWCCTTLLV